VSRRTRRSRVVRHPSNRARRERTLATLRPCQTPSGQLLRPDREEHPIARFDPRPFISCAGWTLSVTTAEKPNWKHWYIVQAKCADDPDFDRFADLIEAEGYIARFEGIAYRYLRVDKFLYWTSRSLWTPGQNINRRPAADVEGQPDHEQMSLLADARG
jgi:hypothetical protein